MSTLTVKRSGGGAAGAVAIQWPIPDSYRTLRNMAESQLPDGPRVIAVTSAEPLAGKSTAAVHLAIAFAQGGRRTLLMDAHLARPAVHEAFERTNENGLTSVLLDGVPLADAAGETDVPNLSVLTAGAPPFSVAVDPLESAGMEALLAAARKAYDVVIVDAPALLASSDASTLAAKSDGVLWVVHAARSRKGRELEARKLAERMRLPVIGCVLNGVKPKR